MQQAKDLKVKLKKAKDNFQLQGEVVIILTDGYIIAMSLMDMLYIYLVAQYMFFLSVFYSKYSHKSNH